MTNCNNQKAISIYDKSVQQEENNCPPAKDGKDGIGVVDITYENPIVSFLLTDGRTLTFELNIQEGNQGVGIQDIISQPNNYIRFILTDESFRDILLPFPENGEDGDDAEPLIITDFSSQQVSSGTQVNISFSDGTDGSFIVPKAQDGEDGINGNVIYSGANDPVNGIGADGDYFINSDSGDFFKLLSGVWTNIGNIKGPKGDTGWYPQFAVVEDIVNLDTNGDSRFILQITDWIGGTGDIPIVGYVSDTGIVDADNIIQAINIRGIKGASGQDGEDGEDGADGENGISTTVYQRLTDPADDNTVILHDGDIWIEA